MRRLPLWRVFACPLQPFSHIEINDDRAVPPGRGWFNVKIHTHARTRNKLHRKNHTRTRTVNIKHSWLFRWRRRRRSRHRSRTIYRFGVAFNCQINKAHAYSAHRNSIDPRCVRKKNNLRSLASTYRSPPSSSPLPTPPTPLKCKTQTLAQTAQCYTQAAVRHDTS